MFFDTPLPSERESINEIPMRQLLTGCFVIASCLVLPWGGCGANDTTGPGRAGGMSGDASGTADGGAKVVGDASLASCNATLTGAETASIPCSRAYVVWTRATGTSTLIIDGIEPNYEHDFHLSIGMPDKPATTTYASSAPEADNNGYVRVMKNLERWEAHGGPAGPGSYAATLTALGPETESQFDVRWTEAHGSVQASLVAVGLNGETGVITFAVTF